MRGPRHSAPGDGKGTGALAGRSRKRKRRSAKDKTSARSWLRFGSEGSLEKGKHRSPRARRSRMSWKAIASLVAVCALAAFLFAVVQRVTMMDVASFFLFGTTDPYISPEREREMQKELRDMIQKEFGARKAKGGGR